MADVVHPNPLRRATDLLAIPGPQGRHRLTRRSSAHFALALVTLLALQLAASASVEVFVKQASGECGGLDETVDLVVFDRLARSSILDEYPAVISSNVLCKDIRML